MAHMFSSRFQKQLCDESALSRFEVLTKPLYECNEDRQYYTTQYQDIMPLILCSQYYTTHSAASDNLRSSLTGVLRSLKESMDHSLREMRRQRQFLEGLTFSTENAG